MKLYLASANNHKAAELTALAAQHSPTLRLQILSASTIGGMPPVDEDTGTFTGNARKKALALRTKLPGEFILADDSGLCVDALNGAPGVESAYYAGTPTNDTANTQKLLQNLRHLLHPSDRRAHFLCLLFLLHPDNTEHIFEARCPGTLTTTPSGSTGFGYDPIFIPDNHTQTFAQLPLSTKNNLSHRSQAFQLLLSHLQQQQ